MQNLRHIYNSYNHTHATHTHTYDRKKHVLYVFHNAFRLRFNIELKFSRIILREVVGAYCDGIGKYCKPNAVGNAIVHK